MSFSSIQAFKPRNITPSPIIPRPRASYREIQKVIDASLGIRTLRERGVTSGMCMFLSGEWSSGKTLTLTFIAKEREVDGIPIVANFELDVDNFIFLDDIEILRNLKNAVVIIDEFRRYADCYQSAGQRSRLISNLVADLGKNSIDFYFSDQHYNAPPTRVRTNVKIWAYPQMEVESEWCYVYLFDSQEKRIFYEPFWYFAFHAPDYWDYYKTRRKIEDYKIKYNPRRHAYRFLAWCSMTNSKPTMKNISYWSIVKGEELSGDEKGAIIMYIEREQEKYIKMFKGGR